MLSEREKKSIDAKVSVYKEDLLVHAYKVKALETRFRDTMVSQTDIEKAYHENQRIIRLSDDLIRVVYVFLDQDSNLKSRVRKILRDMDDQDAFMDLKNICQTHSKKFNINRSKWFTYSNLKRDLPFLEQKNLRSLRFDRVYSFSSGDSKAFCYFIKIVHRGSPAPIDYVKTKLKTIVINRRKLKFVKQLKRSLYKETIKTKDYEVFIKK